MLQKCLIYKRATLYSPDKDPLIIDYSDGTEANICNVVQQPDGTDVYPWFVMGKVIPIPLNIPRMSVDSIVREGQFNLTDTMLVKWEFIYGKSERLVKFYAKMILPWILIFLVVLLVNKSY